MSSIREPSEDLCQCMNAYPEHVQTKALALRKMILQEAPSSFELIYDSYNALSVAYSYTNNLREAFCHIALYGNHVNLGFNYGTELDDPAGRLSGSGKRIRHIKIQKIEELEAPFINTFIQKAIDHIEKKYPAVEKSPQPKAIVKSVSDRKRRPA